jgi:hypothetical protein
VDLTLDQRGDEREDGVQLRQWCRERHAGIVPGIVET